MSQPASSWVFSALSGWRLSLFVIVVPHEGYDEPETTSYAISSICPVGAVWEQPMTLTTEEEYDCWLNGSPEEAHSLIHSYPAEKMRIVQSSTEKKDLLN